MNIISINQDTINISNKTLLELNTQKNQLNKINTTINNINQNIQISEYIIDKFNSLTYRIKNYLYSNPKNETKIFQNSINNNKISNNIPIIPTDNYNTNTLNHITNQINTIKNNSIVINNELDSQLDMLTDINQNIDSSNSKINNINVKIKPLLT